MSGGGADVGDRPGGPAGPVRTIAHWLPVLSRTVRRPRARMKKGRISTGRYQKRPRRIVASDMKLRWSWYQRHGTHRSWVRVGLLEGGPEVRVVRDYVNDRLRFGRGGKEGV